MGLCQVYFVPALHPLVYPLVSTCCFISSVRGEKRCSVEQIRRRRRARLYGRLFFVYLGWQLV